MFDSASNKPQSADNQKHCLPMDLSVDLPPSLLEEPQQWKKLEYGYSDDLTINYIENIHRFKQNVILIKTLQESIILLNESKKP